MGGHVVKDHSSLTERGLARDHVGAPLASAVPLAEAGHGFRGGFGSGGFAGHAFGGRGLGGQGFHAFGGGARG